MPSKPNRVSPALARLDQVDYESKLVVKARIPAILAQEFTAVDVLAQIEYVSGLSLEDLARQALYGAQRTLVESVVLGATFREAKKQLGRDFREWVHHDTPFMSMSTVRYCISICEDFLLVFNDYKDANLQLIPATQIRAAAKALREPEAETRTESKSSRTAGSNPESIQVPWEEGPVAHIHCSCVETLQAFVKELERERDEFKAKVDKLNSQLFDRELHHMTTTHKDEQQNSQMRGQPTPKEYSARKPKTNS
jgi:hypothetical protein